MLLLKQKHLIQILSKIQFYVTLSGFMSVRKDYILSFKGTFVMYNY